MSKLRSVSTAIWSDTWFEELTANQKLVFIYLITNEKTNMLGIYEASTKKISFETGIQKQEVEKALMQFERDGRVKYTDNYVILLKFLKHQNFNTNMKKSAVKVYNELPEFLKIKGLDALEVNDSESFESLSKGLGMVRKIEEEVEYEIEYEFEEEIQKEKERQIEILFDRFWNLYDKKSSKEKCFKKFQALKPEEMEEIFQSLPAYIESTPDKKFRKNPETYLNNKSWNDEIIKPTFNNKNDDGRPKGIMDFNIV